MVVLLLVGGLATMAWGDSLREHEHLLPGTTIAGVDVGDRDVAEAVTAVRDAVTADLHRSIEVTYADRTWDTTLRALGATNDVEQVVDGAFERTTRAGLIDLARLWLGAGGDDALDVTWDAADHRVTSFVAELAAEVDTAPQDATVAWVDGRVHLEEASIGLQVQQDAAAAALELAVADGVTAMALPVAEQPPTFGTSEAQRVADEVEDAIGAALDHEVTIVLEDATRTVTPRQLGATHNAPGLLDARGAEPGDVVLEIADEAIHEVVDEVTAPHEVPSQDAQLAWTAGAGFAVTPGTTGLAVDHQAAITALRSALLAGHDRVELDLHVTQPRITTASFDEVLLVRQAERRVELHRGGQIARSWSVAVGTSGYPTPTGMFTIGAKRFEPTWRNSSPDDWGSDMPAVIGPGPDNPLGLRALNWERDGVDTLIRFHGTANENSIGRAASHGCVRMTNPDVIELYGLVDTGTVILSVAG